MSFVINFYDWDFVKREYRDFSQYRFYPILVKEIAKALEVSKRDLLDAFQTWEFMNKPETYQFEVEPKKFIRIRYDPETYVCDGTVCTVRPWGNHWRGISEGTYSFAIGLMI